MKHYAFLGLPKSGSSWISRIIRLNNSNIRYCHEFFGGGHPKGSTYITKKFGTHHIINNLGCPIDDDMDVYDEIFKNTWKKTNFNFTKEVWSAFKVPFYVRYFETIINFRPRYLTLPGNQYTKEWLMGYYKAIDVNAKSGNLCESLTKGMEVARSICKAVSHKHVAAHLLANYQLLSDAKRFSLPIVNQYDLLKLTGQEFKDYLFDRFPCDLVTDKIATIMEDKKRDNIREKVRRYNKIQRIEDVYFKILDCLADPHELLIDRVPPKGY